MLRVETFALVAFVALWGASKAFQPLNSTEYEDHVLSSPQRRDKFRMIQNNVTPQQLKDNVDDFTSYGCERIVVITNDAPDWFRLWCWSPEDKTGLLRVNVGKSAILSFKPQKGGKSNFWCTLDHRGRWARFDVFSDKQSYICPCGDDDVQRFSVRNDGVYTNGENKIRALSKGRNEYHLKEMNSNNETKLLMIGNVDGGVCSDLPYEFEDKASVFTVCGYQCIEVYENIHCSGQSEILQATGECSEFRLEELDNEVSAVKGC